MWINSFAIYKLVRPGRSFGLGAALSAVLLNVATAGSAG